jgi:hypothetical protein
MREVKYNLSYVKVNGPSEMETYSNISIVGCYGSNDCSNLGFKAWVPERENYRNFAYEGVKGLEVSK